ncbi:MAG: orotidine-5-phosphate decarboxylase [Petroclostridium sp.]|jgi:orotidine-5'-phosphate decarboxylase|uniref:orotidine-5'-phosphate decarboxylase n=1 Tax=Petroclostridium xylanilyticum TaxID=1792311 RepID=UPI000B98F726|nr:orotidine-5'-phosphate decarboxylase [Petroclostridium xylanilyticum]MDK2810667.1 orotidine-5-phosphate decarboxylase [Petroclostridium sp.]
MSIDILIDKIRQKNNPSVVGLDPRIEYVPEFIREECYTRCGRNLKGVAQAILEFNKKLIDELCDIIPAVKPQSAYYEMYGVEGIKTLYETIEYARNKGLYVITDVKRNDIGSTAEAYSTAYLGKTQIEGDIYVDAFASDSITVNPYLGTDGIQPFINDCSKYNKSIFILVKTSNRSSGEVQDLMTAGETVYEKIAALVNQWGSQCMGQKGYSNIGAVVGATYPEQAAKLRKIMPNTYFLVPGYGAQGGTAKDVANCFNKDGLGAIVNSSRGIMCAYINKKYEEKEFAAAAREEAIRMRDEILNCII